MGSAAPSVVLGLYRRSRNPMYVAVGLVLLGWAVGFRSPAILFFGLAVMVAFHVRVVIGEEPGSPARIARTGNATRRGFRDGCSPAAERFC